MHIHASSSIYNKHYKNEHFQVPVWPVDTAAAVWVAAVEASLQIATVMQTATCLKIAVVMFQMTVRNKVLLYYWLIIL